jgi:hypothetical protein
MNLGDPTIVDTQAYRCALAVGIALFSRPALLGRLAERLEASFDYGPLPSSGMKNHPPCEL